MTYIRNFAIIEIRNHVYINGGMLLGGTVPWLLPTWQTICCHLMTLSLVPVFTSRSAGNTQNPDLWCGNMMYMHPWQSLLHIPWNRHTFVDVLWFVAVSPSAHSDSCDQFTHIFQSYFTDTKTIIWLALGPWVTLKDIGKFIVTKPQWIATKCGPWSIILGIYLY